MEFTYQPGQTPLDPDEKEGLKPKHISTQGELNEWEQLNIIKGARWAQRQLKQDILDELAARFHHQLVPIHPFPNGKGGELSFDRRSFTPENGLGTFYLGQRWTCFPCEPERNAGRISGRPASSRPRRHLATSCFRTQIAQSLKRSKSASALQKP